MNGIQTTTSEVLVQGQHLVGQTPKNTLAFQNFLKGYEEGFDKLAQTEQPTSETGMELPQTIEEEEVDEGQVSETLEQPIVALEEVVLPTLEPTNPTPLINHSESMNDPRHFQFMEPTIETGEAKPLLTVEGEHSMTTTDSLFTEKQRTVNSISNQSEASTLQSILEMPSNELPLTEERAVLETEMTGATKEEKVLTERVEIPRMTGQRTEGQKIEIQPQRLENQIPTITLTIPPQMVPQEGTQKVAEVPPAMLEKMSQPIIEKVTTMNGPGTQKMTVELLPEKLGKMEVTIKVTDQKIQLEFVVENAQTKQLLESISTKLERVLNKQEFPQITQGKVTEPTAVATELQGETAFFDQSAFQQGFQRERPQQLPFGKGAKSKSFAEITLEKMEDTPRDGSIDLLV